ncbi:MAG TPA: glycerophosphodiester phosphodiesterase family protein, partial [Candidatus Limnocylindria bacterium]|nr:glycerophosphodiester phosphodiesterase family protein [Candidatus Limnocylindria bacterium]
MAGRVGHEVKGRTMQLLGHRGAKGEAPENTIPGFEYAKHIPGLDAFEFDVHLAKDGTLVVIHDATVDRTTNATGPVAGFTAAELAALDARAAFPDWPAPCGVPTLDQVLDVLADIPMMQIEIKTDTPDRLERVVPLLLTTIHDRQMEEQVIITSFDPAALAIVQRLEPDYPQRGYIGKWDSDDFLTQALALGCTQANI